MDFYSLDVDTCPLTHGLDETSASGSVEVRPVLDEVEVARAEIG